jgi:hypothetical protein
MASYLRTRIRILALASALGVAVLVAAAAMPASAATTSLPSPGSTDAFQVYNYNSGLCLGITGGEDKAPAVQWTCLGTSHPDQYWHWGTTVGGYVVDPDGNVLPAYQLINGDGECLGIEGGETTEGADAVGWTCLGTGHPDQYWALDTYISCSGYNPLIDLNSGYVLGVLGNSTKVGASVVQWAYQGVCNNQFWA